MKKTFGKTRRGFTLVEIMVALAVLLILGSIALISYFKFLDKARETVCESNLKGLHKAVEVYVIENEALPAILGQLEPRHLKSGYEFAMREGGWQANLAYSFVKISFTAEAHADLLTYETLKDYGATRKCFSCSADGNGGISYSLNAAIAGKKWREIEDHVIIIADGDSATFEDVTELSFRHANKKKALAITKNGVVIKICKNSDDTIDIADGDSEEDAIEYAEQNIDDACPCDNGWKNHGKYVSCVSNAAQQQVDNGLVSDAEIGAIVSERAQSNCGK